MRRLLTRATRHPGGLGLCRSLQTYPSFEAEPVNAQATEFPAQNPASRHSKTEQALENRWHAFIRPTFRALLVDAAGTLLSPSEPAAEVYLRYARKYGVTLSAKEILLRYREAYNRPWADSTIRYVDDGRPFWRYIVGHATGCHDEELFEEIYHYYARGEAWCVSPGAVEALERVRNSFMLKTAVVSNFDTRLRLILRDLGIDHLFDAVIVSAEVGFEKPNPVVFEAAFEALGVTPEETVHVGDDRRNDLYGARAAGCFAWLWGADVHNFAEVERRLETGNVFDSLSGV